MTFRKASDIYPITTIKYPNWYEVEVIMDEHIEDYTAPIELESFEHYLYGQTRIAEGYYVGDVEMWLNKRPVTD